MPVFRTFKKAPISVCLVWISCILFVGVWCETSPADNGFNAALHTWGAAVETVKVGANEIVATLGPTHVWDGDWWRLLVDNLHHVNLLHLTLNGIAMVILGRIIEPRMSHAVYFLFITGAFFTVGALSALTGELGIGLSGVLYALVGLLFVWRDRDEAVAEEFTMNWVIGAGIWLMLCQLLTYLDIIAIGNVAHYTGFIYGWMWGQVYLEKQQKLIFRFLFTVGHLLLIPAFWFAMNPFWSGAWHYHLAFEKGISSRQRLERLQTACLRAPDLSDAWWRLSRIYEENHDPRLAMKVAMEGLKHNRGSQKLLDRTTELWTVDALRTDKPMGPTFAQQVFDKEADPWIEKISKQANKEIQRMSWDPDRLVELMGQSITPSPNLNLEDLNNSSKDLQPSVDPDSPDSALEGEIF